MPRLQIKAAEQMLQLIDELKSPVVCNEARRHNRLVRRRCASLDRETNRVNAAVAQLSREVDSSIAELEQHYYTSCHRENFAPL